MTSRDIKSLTHYLVGPGASADQIRLVLIPALLSALACATLAAQQGERDWVVAVVCLIAFDVVGGCIACSLPPLQGLHRTTYGRPLLQALFQIGHAGHVLVLAFLLADTAFGPVVIGLGLLLSGAIAGAGLPSAKSGGLRVLVVLIWIAYVVSLPWNSMLFNFLSIVLFIKLFIAFPSFNNGAGQILNDRSSK